MSKKQKLIEKLLNPNCDNGWNFKSVSTLLKQLGYTLTRTTGSHHHFYKEKTRLTIASHNNKINKATIDDIRNRYNKDKSNG